MTLPSPLCSETQTINRKPHPAKPDRRWFGSHPEKQTSEDRAVPVRPAPCGVQEHLNSSHPWIIKVCKHYQRQATDPESSCQIFVIDSHLDRILMLRMRVNFNLMPRVPKRCLQFRPLLTEPDRRRISTFACEKQRSIIR
jgi:hypothetical protein